MYTRITSLTLILVSFLLSAQLAAAAPASADQVLSLPQEHARAVPLPAMVLKRWGPPSS
ncbi:hypothetical protein B0H17DRAFT_1196293 [Mycena rosella]|uniref:Uncharacterized protein n=1 Tax=Mycena rosella TaxID=1033263 RepID=A0AAD7GQ45_MYCRO|nr:hypothetical protein B0H17DRAFT_1196293 [Mycena rosella]